MHSVIVPSLPPETSSQALRMCYFETLLTNQIVRVIELMRLFRILKVGGIGLVGLVWILDPAFSLIDGRKTPNILLSH